MDQIIMTLAGKVMSLLVPYAASTAQDFINTIGELGYEKAKTLLNKLKAKWSGDTGSSVILEKFENEPEQFKAAMEAILQQKLSQDQTLVEELSKMMIEMGPTLEIIQRMDEAENITGLEAQEMSRGKVSIEQDVKKAKNLTGAKIDRIG